MIDKFIVPLGGRSAASLPTHAGIRALDRAARAGMPVPAGYVVLPALADLAVLHGALTVNGGRIEVHDPSVVRLWLDGAAAAGSAVWVRGIHAVERSTPSQPAHVPANDLLSAVISLWQTHLHAHADATIQPVLIQDAPPIEQYGLAWTSAGIGRDHAAIASGARFRDVVLERLFGWERAPNPPEIEPAMARIQALLRDVRRWLGGEHWQIEWVDDGSTCWLLSVQPCESERPHRGIGALVPTAGIGGGPFTPLVADVFRAAIDRAWSKVTAIENGLTDLPPPACVAHNRLYVDPADTATALQTFGLGNGGLLPFVPPAQDVRLPPRTGRLLRSLGRGTALRLLAAHLRAVLTTPRAHALDTTVNDARALVDLFDRTAEVYGRLFWRVSHVWIAATVAAGVDGQQMLLAALQGTADAGRLAAYARFRDLASDYLSVRKAIERGEMPNSEEFQAVWEEYAQRWGARTENELELAAARDHEHPLAVVREIVMKQDTAQQQRRRGLKGALMRPLLARAARLGESFARDLDIVRHTWLVAADWLAERGLIEGRDDIWLLTRADLERLVLGWRPEGEFWTRRRAEWTALLTQASEPVVDRIFCSERGKSLDTPRG